MEDLTLLPGFGEKKIRRLYVLTAHTHHPRVAHPVLVVKWARVCVGTMPSTSRSSRARRNRSGSAWLLGVACCHRRQV